MFTPNCSNSMAPATRGVMKQTMLDLLSRPKSRATQKNATAVDPSVMKEKNKRQVVEQWNSTSGSEDGLPDVDEDTSADGGASQRTIFSAVDGRAFLQREALISSNEGLDLDNMVSALTQILLMKGMSVAARDAVRSIALILAQLKSEPVSKTLVSAMEKRVDAMMAKTVERVMESLKVTIDLTVTEIRAASTNMATSATQIAAMTTSYRDALKSMPKVSDGANAVDVQLAPRLQAREGIQARQVLLDVGAVDGPRVEMLRGGSIAALKERLDDTLCRCGSGDSPTQHKTRAMTRLQNGGILMELDSDAAVDWFARDDIRKQFLEGLPPVSSSGIAVFMWSFISSLLPLGRKMR